MFENSRLQRTEESQPALFYETPVSATLKSEKQSDKTRRRAQTKFTDQARVPPAIDVPDSTIESLDPSKLTTLHPVRDMRIEQDERGANYHSALLQPTMPSPHLSALQNESGDRSTFIRLESGYSNLTAQTRKVAVPISKSPVLSTGNNTGHILIS
mmetsp:Transcript_24007/g.36896  ORF Transcript_24007/g.36896 Transcript_24007/m.36896 type:complete len:156 (+) Transcript_24007:1760-2227(+)